MKPQQRLSASCPAPGTDVADINCNWGSVSCAAAVVCCKLSVTETCGVIFSLSFPIVCERYITPPSISDLLSLSLLTASPLTRRVLQSIRHVHVGLWPSRSVEEEWTEETGPTLLRIVTGSVWSVKTPAVSRWKRSCFCSWGGSRELLVSCFWLAGVNKDFLSNT